MAVIFTSQNTEAPTIPESIVFASDYPWAPRQMALEHVRGDADAATAGRILSDNRLPGLLPVGRASG